MREKALSTADETIDAALYRLFPNYAGTIRNAYGEYPVSYLELSRPTGRYVSGLLLRELNLLIRKHSIVMIGNSCAPGYFFPEPENGGPEQFLGQRPRDCGVFIANFKGTPPENHGMVCFEAEPFMVLNLRSHWNSFDDYLADMSSKYRVRAKKVFEVSRELEVQEFTGDNIPEKLLQTCALLLGHTLREKTLVLNKNLGGILHRFGEHFGKSFSFRVYYHEGKPVGFITCSVRNGTLYAWHVGYRDDIAGKTQMYQRMLYDLVKHGIASGCSVVNFGRTATEIKSTLGAEPQGNYFMVYAKSKILASLLRFYKKHHYRLKTYVIRKPFRD